MGISRRAFLQLSAALGAALLQQTARPSTAPRRGFAHAQCAPTAGSLSIASTFPLPFPHRYFPDAERLLDDCLDAFDLLLVPAYAAVNLIRRGALQILPGVPGRPHDPDGAYTFPYLTAISALVYRGARPASLDDLWARDALWPDSPRLVIGAALLRRGYPLNDSHPGHLTQVGEDLLRLRPRLVPDPLADLRSGRASLAMAVIPASGTGMNFLRRSHPSASPRSAQGATAEGLGVRIFIPPEGAALIEYDWVISLGARNAEAALAFIANPQYGIGNIAKHLRGTQYAFDASAPKLTPLTPLPAAALAQRASIWKRLKETTT
jgi:spermidine/putrescine-binding protein